MCGSMCVCGEYVCVCVEYECGVYVCMCTAEAWERRTHWERVKGTESEREQRAKGNRVKGNRATGNSERMGRRWGYLTSSIAAEATRDGEQLEMMPTLPSSRWSGVNVLASCSASCWPARIGVRGMRGITSTSEMNFIDQVIHHTHYRFPVRTHSSHTHHTHTSKAYTQNTHISLPIRTHQGPHADTAHVEPVEEDMQLLPQLVVLLHLVDTLYRDNMDGSKMDENLSRSPSPQAVTPCYIKTNTTDTYTTPPSPLLCRTGHGCQDLRMSIEDLPEHHTEVALVLEGRDRGKRHDLSEAVNVPAACDVRTYVCVNGW